MRLLIGCIALALLAPAVSAGTLELAPVAPLRSLHDAGASAPSSPSTPVGTHTLAAVEDPEGDAREKRPDAVRGVALASCRSVVGGTCGSAGVNEGGPTGTPTDELGTPARPLADLLALTVEETASDVIVTFEVASLPQDPVTSLEENEILRFSAQFGDDPDARPSGSVHVLFQDMRYYHAAKVDVLYNGGPFGADWSAPYEILAGTPGAIRVSVPRAYFPYQAAGEAFGISAWGETWHYQVQANGSTPYVDAWAAQSYSSSSPSTMVYEWIDQTDTVELAAFSLAHEPRSISTDPRVDDDVGETGEAAFDILSTRIIENATHLGIEATIATVDDEPAPYLFALIDIPSPPEGVWPGFYAGFELTAGSSLVEGERRTYATAYESTEHGWVSREIEALFEHEPGDPGVVRFFWSRADAGNPEQAAMLSQVEFLLWEPDSTVYQEVDEIGAGVDAGFGGSLDPGGSKYDYAEHRRPYFLATEAATNLAPLPLSRVEDATDDVILPPEVALADPSYAQSVDITFIEAKAVKPGESRVALGVRDLGNVRIPRGYEAIVYAVAVETASGPFMAVYYRSEGVKEFFCAPDVTVFPELDADKQDPYDAIWTPIEGTVAAAPAQAGGGAGSIVFRVPNTCFGEEQGDTLSGTKLASGTYLIRSTPVSAEVITLDQVSAETPVVLGAALAPVGPAPWYEAPLGIREFWNILGVALALGGGGIAVLARQRRRTVLQRQLAAIDEIHSRERADAAAWKRAMGERRALAGDLLRRHKLRPDEVLVIERRIELLVADVAEPVKTAIVAAVGTTLAQRYRLDRLLGEGAQGRAFLARDLTLGRDVVLKLLATAGMDARSRRALLAEARLMAMIDHPNVVRVLDVRETEAAGEIMLILEYVEGGSLRALLERRGRVAKAEALAIARGVLAGLEAAHAAGVVHRDVKPENILLTKDGAPKLADFGAARDTTRGATIVALSAGTLDYMSPEQVRGVAVDPRSDLYSTAVVLHEMLTGRAYLPLRDGDEFQARAMILEKAPTIALDPEAAALAGLLLRALAKEPAERFANATQMRHAIEAAST